MLLCLFNAVMKVLTMFVCVPHPTVLRVNFCFCDQGSLLMGLRDHLVCLGSNPGWLFAKQVLYPWEFFYCIVFGHENLVFCNNSSKLKSKAEKINGRILDFILKGSSQESKEKFEGYIVNWLIMKYKKDSNENVKKTHFIKMGFMNVKAKKTEKLLSISSNNLLKSTHSNLSNAYIFTLSDLISLYRNRYRYLILEIFMIVYS